MEENNNSSLGNIISCVISVIIIISMVFGCVECCDQTYQGTSTYTKIIKKHKLYSIQNATTSSGHISGISFAIVGSLSGSLDQSEIVYVYEGTKDGGIKLHKYNYDDVEFKFIKKNETPYIEDYITCRTDTTRDRIGHDCVTYVMYKGIYGTWHKYYDSDYIKHNYIIHIPVNSITNTYDLNLKNLQ